MDRGIERAKRIDTSLPVPLPSLNGALIALHRTGREPGSFDGSAADLVELYPPPFELTSDMLFCAALCPAAPLQRAFPDIPLLSLFGKALLVMWFSRVKEICYRDEPDRRRCLGSVGTVLYNELNVITFLRRRAIFVPGIYATSELTILMGHRYGMPKQPALIRFQAGESRLDSMVLDRSRQSLVHARLLNSGRGLARIVSRFWPWRSWPALFPSGSAVRPLIQATPRVRLALVHSGRLELEASWLPRPAALFPIGLYVPNLRMQLPPP